eukprot:CAMPEP_0205828190 /NCGR_PEP_ID=MMETSP0206-20130828/34305_1 /ASSEMBLY_ACC=CAM_ASM_000279 /TAXON_ID=36767 /ORGANISM="Euplotes focardii, Strain TN1" /LENGTH=84 /DNA_ID=CAMNT_0053129743 /DNA_START=24 /DNA_END=274 /DNA_ORIENTATION=+
MLGRPPVRRRVVAPKPKLTKKEAMALRKRRKQESRKRLGAQYAAVTGGAETGIHKQLEALRQHGEKQQGRISSLKIALTVSTVV